MFRQLFSGLLLASAAMISQAQAGGHCHSCQSGHCANCASGYGYAHGYGHHAHRVPRACLPSDLRGMRQAQRALQDPCYWSQPWHGEYYHTGWGVPVALVVPPTVGRVTEYSWGVSGTRVTPLYRQFNREYPGAVNAGGFLPTPKWPSDTAQFGVYPVRGPW